MLEIEGLDVEQNFELWKFEFLDEIWVISMYWNNFELWMKVLKILELWNKMELFQYVEIILSCENEGTFGDFLQHFTAFDKIHPHFDNIPF